MAWLAAAAPYAAIGVQAYEQRKEGKERRKQLEFDAQQRIREGKLSQAEANRAASENLRKAKFMESRARAVAAASGAGATDPTIENILGEIDAEGEYRALSDLYSGDTDNQLAKAQAGAYRNEGLASEHAGNLSAATTVLSGAADFYNKYGTPKKRKG